MSDVPTAPDPDGPGSQEILAIVLDKPSRASELLLSLANLAGEGRLKMHDAVIVTKDDGGHTRIVETIDVTPVRGALSGTWWGMLGGLLIGGPVFLGAAIGGAAAGALYGKLVDKGLEDQWVKDMAAWIDPDTSALLLLVDAGLDPAVIEELKRFDGIGKVAGTTLPAGTKAEVEAALGPDVTDSVSVERVIPAPASAIFDLIADPNRHQDIDGSGTVRSARGKVERLRLGSRFGMSMVMGLPYAMESTVIEFEEDRLLAWQTRGPTAIGRLVGGRIWRYELEPTDGGTLVRETWDISQESPLTKLAVQRGGKTAAKNMAATLERIEQLLTA